MRGDIAIAGYMITAQEWNAFDALARAQLCAVITRREDAAVDAPALAIGSGAAVETADGSGTIAPIDRAPADPSELPAVFAALAESSLFFIADDPFAHLSVIGSWLMLCA